MRKEVFGGATLYLGDSREVLPEIRDAHAVVTDPPYELGFMGKGWDRSGIANDPALWALVQAAMRPGAHLLAFSGARTYHRMTCAIEDAGLEIRDQIMWIYGQGFPKSRDVSKLIDAELGAVRTEIVGVKPGHECFADRTTTGHLSIEGAHDGWKRPWQTSESASLYHFATAPATEEARNWQGWGTALKPAHEPICVARNPLAGTIAANALEHGCGAINIAATRVPIDPAADASQLRTMNRSVREGDDGWGMSTIEGDTPQVVRPEGRWPANLVHDGSAEVIAAFPETLGQKGAIASDYASDRSGGIFQRLGERGFTPMRGDAGSAARFFYCAKASRSDRNCSGRNGHPTVKPTDLMRWLCRLVTPPGGIVLDPFMGSGSTGKGAIAEGFSFIGIEKDPAYFEIACRRLDPSCIADEPEIGPEDDERPTAVPQMNLFASPL